MLEAYPNERTPSNVLFNESPALHTNKFYKTGPSPFFIVHERFLNINKHDAWCDLIKQAITSIQCKVLEI